MNSDTGITASVRDLIAIHVTVADEDDAERIGHALIEARLAACVQTSEITSRYRWQGKVEEDSEYLLVIKTMGGALDAVARMVMEMHPYDEPEIVALPIIGASAGYAAWVRKCVSVQ